MKNKIITTVLVIVLTAPLQVLAQTTTGQTLEASTPDTSVSSEESQTSEIVVVTPTQTEQVIEVPVNDSTDLASTTVSDIIEAPPDPVDPQIATSTQQTLQADVLEDTQNPQDTSVPPVATTTEVVVDDPSTTPTTNTTDPNTTNIQIPVPPSMPTPVQPVVSQIQPIVQTVVMIDQASLEPKGEYVLALDGRAKATVIEDGNGKNKDKIITDVPVISVEDESTALNVSGTCADKYFVILVYRNEGDYNADRSSYIFNKAFDCINGQYSYSISDLPKDLEDGRYYLLVGGQGDKGGWQPISALVPITINKK